MVFRSPRSGRRSEFEASQARPIGKAPWASLAAPSRIPESPAGRIFCHPCRSALVLSLLFEVLDTLPEVVVLLPDLIME